MGKDLHGRLGLQQGYFWIEILSLNVQSNGFRGGQPKIDQPRSVGTLFYFVPLFFLLSFLQKKNNSVSFSWQYFKKELSPGTKT